MTPSVSKTCCSDMKFNSSCFMVRRVVFLGDKIWLVIKKSCEHVKIKNENSVTQPE